MTNAQTARVRELTDLLRIDHATVHVHVSRITVAGSRIAATVEPDGGAWLTWADGTRTYSPASGEPFDIPNQEG